MLHSMIMLYGNDKYWTLHFSKILAITCSHIIWYRHRICEKKNTDKVKTKNGRPVFIVSFRKNSLNSVLINCLNQGQNRIWYAGVSASYESVRSVVSYNNRLLKQMVPLSKYKRTSKSLNPVASQTVFQPGKGVSTAISVKNCKYSCSTGGGCKVKRNWLQWLHFLIFFSAGWVFWTC